MKNIRNKNRKNDNNGVCGCPVCQSMKENQPEAYEKLMQFFAQEDDRMKLRVLDKDELFYDAMEAVSDGDYGEAKEMLIRAQEIDPHYVQTYVGLTSVYHDLVIERRG